MEVDRARDVAGLSRIEADDYVVGPGRRRVGDVVVEAFGHLPLLRALVLRTVMVRYGSTALGLAWGVVQPLAYALVMWVVMRRIVGVATDGVPYFASTLAGLACWAIVSRSIVEGTTAFVSNTPFVTKLYMPRILVPVATTLEAATDFLLVAVVAVVAALSLGVFDPTRIYLMIPAVVIATTFATGTSLVLSVLTARWRDFRFVGGFAAQIGLFATPVFWPWQSAAGLAVPAAINPMYSSVALFQASILPKPVPDAWSILISTVVAAMVLSGGLWWFARNERRLAECL